MEEHVSTLRFQIPLYVIVNKGGMERNVKHTPKQKIVNSLINNLLLNPGCIYVKADLYPGYFVSFYKINFYLFI
jgi:hypothetical protein